MWCQSHSFCCKRVKHCRKTINIVARVRFEISRLRLHFLPGWDFLKIGLTRETGQRCWNISEYLCFQDPIYQVGGGSLVFHKCVVFSVFFVCRCCCGDASFVTWCSLPISFNPLRWAQPKRFDNRRIRHLRRFVVDLQNRTQVVFQGPEILSIFANSSKIPTGFNVNPRSSSQLFW